VKYLLDTSVISDIRKKNGSPRVIAFVNSLPPEDVYISILSVGEIAYGIEKLHQGKKRAELFHWLNDQIPAAFKNRIISPDSASMLEWGKLRAGIGRTLPYIDSLLAATALAYRLIILTRNIRHFDEIGGLSLLNPWE
jgi:predicted nucleic acid-binding protein